MFYIKQTEIEGLYSSILAGDYPMELRESDGDPHKAYKEPISHQVEFLLNLIEENDVQDDQADQIVDQLINQLKSQYSNLVRLT